MIPFSKRLKQIRAAAVHGLPQVMAASLLLWGSSCSSTRELAWSWRSRLDRTAAAEMTARSPQNGSVEHAVVAAKEEQSSQVTQLSVEQPAPEATLPAQTASADPFIAADPPSPPPVPQVSSPVVAAAEATTAVPVRKPREFPRIVEPMAEAVSSAPASTVPPIQQIAYDGLSQAAETAASRSVPAASPVAQETVSATVETTPAAGSVISPPQQTAPASVPVAAPITAEISDVSATTPVPSVVDCPPLAVPAVNCPPFDCPPGNCPPAAVNTPFLALSGLYQVPAVVVDEYLCDGGDKELPIHYQGLDRLGLDTEDTVVEFRDHNGVAHVQPSSRTCIYAPRFAAVESFSEPMSGYSIARATGTHDGQPLAALHGRTVIDEQVQRDSLYAMHMRARASGLEKLETDDEFVKAERHTLHAKLLNAFEDYGFVRDGHFDKVDEAILEQAIAAAFAWDGDLHLGIFAQDQSGQVVVGRRFAEDMTGVEDRRKGGELQIVKVADKAAAHPGDIVTFTIRFDNLGTREFNNVRVVDNLTPRLQLIEGSIQSSAAGSMHLEPSGSGGQVLTFEFTDPLPGRGGAHITFQCKVL